mmetsp:Transcript_7035/g.19843  ORF Transcript_7035/g.19843 Transcript_7035/m.19843 type:complete len:235 (-) Transcript_7035:658-1362(-)|eukprot:CAMPEP_0117669154 /NCGR_PEP_ID=MMETSP0804-20121206/11961_1 /TAXON_ID=1074897 /ORGANISM="Tetraselmis astigmatica, Strain CCMP880" /LENGTH=234 /DNA_ID=CAMNT_0005477153 /DNA_START=855 /DNA_END=1559 /DNA_ORIENTATION=-
MADKLLGLTRDVLPCQSCHQERRQPHLHGVCEGHVATQKLVGEDAKGPYIAGRRVLVVVKNLGGDVTLGAKRPAGPVSFLVPPVSLEAQAKVAQLQRAAAAGLSPDDVGRFQVPVEDPLPVKGSQPAGNLSDDVGHKGLLHGAPYCQQVAQRGALAQLHDEVEPRVVLEHIEQMDQVLVGCKVGGYAPHYRELSPDSSLADIVVTYDLDRCSLTRRFVHSPVHCAEAALAQFLH